MPHPERRATRAISSGALLLSLVALVVPAVGALAFSDAMGGQRAFLWLLALVPAFALGYYRGGRGVATALGIGISTLALTEVVALAMGHPFPTLLPVAALLYLTIGAGVGWLSETLHRDRLEVEDLAFTDLLTGLPNRRHALVFLQNEFAAAERGRLLSVVLFDLDHFKQYNDTFGHPAGDQALEVFAEVLSHTTRRMNLSARYGGEEFLSVLAGSDPEGAYAFAERVRTALRAKNLGSPALTVSAGVAVYEEGMSHPDELLANADKALYEAKKEGRNCVRVFAHPELPIQAFERAAEESRKVGDALLASFSVHEEEDSSPSEVSSDGLGRGRTALLVEDDDHVRLLIASFLKREGFQVTQAPDVPHARDVLDSEFDLVLTDIRMPGPSGDELVAEVKKRWPTTQVIVITGLQDARVATEALNAGADRYLFKPFGMPELRSHLTEALARRDQFKTEIPELALNPLASTMPGLQSKGTVVKGLRALVRAAEDRDPHARGHSIQVAEYARVIADIVDPEGDELDRESLRLACEAHDVGVIAVPEGILNKQGRLSTEELAKVRQHTLVGRRILEPLLTDELVLGVVRWHHERWDGTGYPDGLAGEDIPLGARVVALAEALAAMTRPRPYRGSLTWEEVVEEVRSLSGKQFDPALLEHIETIVTGLKELDPDALLAGKGEETGAASVD